MAIRIVSLLAKIGLDGSGFQQGIRQVKHASQDLGFSMDTLKHQLVGAFSVYGLERLARHVIESVSRFKNMAEQMNITTDEVQQFDAAAIHSGQSLDDLAQPLNKLAVARKKAAEGDKELRETFAHMGVTLKELNDPALRNIDIMKIMSDNLEATGFNARDAAEFVEIFGRKGQQVAAIFRDLKDVHISPIPEEEIEKIHEFVHALEMLALRLTAFAANAVHVKWWDFLPFGMNRGGVDPNSVEGANAPAMSTDEVAAANARRHFQEQQKWEAGPEGPLFRDKAKEKEQAALEKELAELRVKLAEKVLKVHLDMISVTQKRLALEKEIARHDEAAFWFKNATNGDQKKALEEEIKAMELRDELQNLKPEKGSPYNFHLGQFERIGAASGITTARALELAKPSENQDQKKIVQYTGETAQVLKNLDKKIKDSTPTSSFF